MSLFYLAFIFHPLPDKYASQYRWEGKYGKNWKFEWNEKTGLPLHIYGDGIYIGEVEESNADEKARRFLRENKDVLGKDLADSLIIRAIKLQPRFFSEFLDDLTTVDDNDGTLSNGSPHVREICKAFSDNHGIKSEFCAVQ